MAKKVVCTQCGYVGEGKGAIKGNGFIELILWFFIIIPGLIYSIWRSSSRHKVCPQCKSASLIPVDSPRAKKIMLESGMTEEEATAVQQEPDNSFVAKHLGWFKKHPVYTVIILLVGVPMVIGMISAIFN